MFICIELVTGTAQQLKTMSQQEIQALMDTEDYSIIKIESNLVDAKLSAQIADATGQFDSVPSGTFHQDGSIVEIRG